MRPATVRVIDQPRNLCLAVVVGGRVVERFFYGRKNRFFQPGVDDPKFARYATQMDSANAYAEGWRNAQRKEK